MDQAAYQQQASLASHSCTLILCSTKKESLQALKNYFYE